jgi:hypothetical protein
MEIPDYPSNRDRDKDNLKAPENKNVHRVTSSDPIRQKKSLGKKFRSTFFNGDGKTALQYIVFGVLIPAAKDTLVEAGTQGIERLVFGDSRRSRSGPTPTSGPTGYVSYNRYSMSGNQNQRIMSPRARSQHDFDEIVLTSRVEAEEVIDRLFDLVSRYGTATVADLYELVGSPSSHTDQKWGWTDIRGAGVSRVRNGYLLDLPRPDPLTS